MDVSVMTEVFGRRNGEALDTERRPSFECGEELLLLLYLISQGVSFHVFNLPQEE